MPIESVYRPDSWLPFVYPPSSLPWFKSLALVSFWPGFAAWSLLSLACFVIATRSRVWWFMLLSPGLIECLVFGQTSLLVGALLLWACSRHGWQMGALLALALSLKPQMLIMAPMIMLVRRDWPAIVGGLVASATLLLLTTSLYGPRIWADWLHAMPAFAQVIDDRKLYWAVITPYGLARWIGLPALPISIACAGISFGAVLRSGRSWEELPMPIAVTSILVAPYAVPHDLVAALPWCASVLLRGGRDWRQAPAALIFSAVMVPFAAVALAFSWIWPKNPSPSALSAGKPSAVEQVSI